MARRNRRAAGGEPRPLFGGALNYTERAGRRWAVRSISGSAATKTYRCPGCNQEVRPGVSHVVAWPVGDAAERSSTRWEGADGGGDDRRHWHTACWQRSS